MINMFNYIIILYRNIRKMDIIHFLGFNAFYFFLKLLIKNGFISLNEVTFYFVTEILTKYKMTMLV
jgi:hypothetical protein